MNTQQNPHLIVSEDDINAINDIFNEEKFLDMTEQEFVQRLLGKTSFNTETLKELYKVCITEIKKNPIMLDYFDIESEVIIVLETMRDNQ